MVLLYLRHRLSQKGRHSASMSLGASSAKECPARSTCQQQRSRRLARPLACRNAARWNLRRPTGAAWGRQCGDLGRRHRAQDQRARRRDSPRTCHVLPSRWKKREDNGSKSPELWRFRRPSCEFVTQDGSWISGLQCFPERPNLE
jgi:hypothetical protein